MKQLGLVFGFIFWLLGLAAAPRVCAEFRVSTGLRYDAFADDHSPKSVGYELTQPIGLTYRWRHLLLGCDVALSSANVFPGDGSDAELSGLTDTHLSLSYGLPHLPVGMIFGVDLNLPTGREHLTPTQKAAEIGENHDLFEVDDFGEGVNVEFNLGLAKQIGAFSLSLNGAYQINGEYDPTQNTPDDDLNPGDRLRVAGLLKWQAVSWLDIETSLGYSHFSADTTNGARTFQEGDQVTVGATLHIRTVLHKPLSIVAGLQQTFQGKNTVLDAEQNFQTEPENSNGCEVCGVLDLSYHHSPRFTPRLLSDVRYYGESERKSSANGLPVEGRRVRYALGPGFIYQPTPRLTITSLVKYFVLHQDQDTLVDQETAFRGVNLAVGLTYTF